MSGVGWLVFSWGAIAIFLVVTAYRVVRIARLPVHLRWELAPVPHEKGKADYGGSYLEDYEWWKRRRQRSVVAPALYMAREILFLRGVWRNNRSLWPFSFALHGGLYLIILTLLIELGSALLYLAGLGPASRACLGVISVLAFCGYLLGIFGTIGLIIKRAFDRDLRWSNSRGTFLNLALLGVLFVSGLCAWGLSDDPAMAACIFVRDVVSLNRPSSISSPLAFHVVLLFTCGVYLPFTGMVHFVTKYFMYHGVRWDDEPRNGRMERELAGLLARPVAWERIHGGVKRRSWAEVVREENEDGKA
jgi:nitrate reductase gamma subunit